jgi:transposase
LSARFLFEKLEQLPGPQDFVLLQSPHPTRTSHSIPFVEANYMSIDHAHFVGIDVGKDTLDVGATFKTKRSSYSNDARGIACLVKELNQARPEIVVFEATGGYERPLRQALHAAGIPLHLANPYRVREFAKGMGISAKTDAIDSGKVLVQYAQMRRPDPTPAPDPDLEAIDQLRTRSRQLVDIRAGEKNRLHTAPESVQDDIKEHIRWLDNKIKDLDRQIAQKVRDTPKLKQTADVLRSAPGIGPAALATLLSGLPELGALHHKNLASLVGVAPFADDSGKHKGKRFIQGGRAHVRCALYMAVLTTIRLSARFKNFYQSLLAKGKPKKLAIVACVRKLLTVLNAMVRNNQSWCPDACGA